MITSFGLNSAQLCTPLKKMEAITSKRTMFRRNRNCIAKFEVKACFPNPSDERILKEALSEPVAFMGGVFAGLLRLNLSEDPLKEWVARTVEASGITEEEINTPDSATEEIPQQIEIE